MPAIVIAGLVILAVGLVAAIATPAILAGDRQPPPPPAPTPAVAPADPAPLAAPPLAPAPTPDLQAAPPAAAEEDLSLPPWEDPRVRGSTREDDGRQPLPARPAASSGMAGALDGL